MCENCDAKVTKNPKKNHNYSAPCAVKKSKQKQISPFQTKQNCEIFKLWSLTTICWTMAKQNIIDATIEAIKRGKDTTKVTDYCKTLTKTCHRSGGSCSE
jgi:hypothetical protein